MADFFDKIENDNEKFKIQRPTPGVTVIFSNSSNPPKWFALTISQLVVTLEDIRDNVQDFIDADAADYVEKTWRDLMSSHLSDEVANALSTVQTRPIFTLLSKIVHHANFDEDDYEDGYIDLEVSYLDAAIAELKSYNHEQLVQGAKQATSPNQNTPRATGGTNVIYYGAPGTGKSYAVEQLTQTSGPSRVVRTVFHPDTQNSDFIGALKPAINEEDDISYRFSPGPFAKALVAAYLDPGNMHWFIIEELNRAPAAAVFGELFQMLDRDDDGTGKYDVNFPSDEFDEWWIEKTGETGAKLRLPSNLSIAASMNSADQGVFPLDTAFRRRWNQEYVMIDYASGPTGDITIAAGANQTVTVDWQSFVRRLNEFLTDEIGSGISEDRLIGQWFLSDSELGAELPGKLMIYLWDDLLRHHGRDVLFRPTIKAYGELSRLQKEGKPIFSDKFLELFSEDQADKE